jgi:hypothetical protein
MDSHWFKQTFFSQPLSPIFSGVEVYSPKKEFIFLQKYSNAGMIAGVFLAKQIAHHVLFPLCASRNEDKLKQKRDDSRTA